MDKSAREAAKDVICEIIVASHRRLEGKTRLFKAFYYAHLYHWLYGKGTLTDYPIVRLPQGPGIDQAEQLLSELQQEGRIRVTHKLRGPYPEHVYECDANIEMEPNSARTRAINEAVQMIEAKTAAQISEEVHEFSRSWQEAKDGEELNIYVDLVDDEDAQALESQRDEVKDLMHAVFG